MAVDYRELNKVTLAIHATVPNEVQILEKLTTYLDTWHTVWDLANTFFGIPKAQDMFPFTWKV